MASPEAPQQVHWLTDRTRYTTSTGRCRRQRYLTNHFGPTGYGIVRKAESLPLATGKYVHQALEYVCKAMQKDDVLPSEATIRQGIADACDAYHAAVRTRGYAGLLQSERADYIVVEQTCLLTGLVWAFATLILPWLHSEYRILEVEQESVYPLTDEIGIMLRQDVLAVPRTREEGLAYFEFKTTGYAGDAWSQAWETKPQLPIGTFGVEERLGRKVTECYIIGLYKGMRKTVGEGAEQWQRQESPFCYGFCKPGNPPLSTDDWKPSYEWVDHSTGDVKRASRAHVKQGVWTLPSSDWDLAVVNRDIPPAEWWAKQLPKDVLAKQVFLVGPLARQEAQIEALKRQIVGEEQQWQSLLWDLYEVEQVGHPWASDPFQAELDRLVPASWDCRRFGTRHQCEFVPICFKQPGWEDPLGMGKFAPRRPHHQPELDAAVARGLLPADAEELGEEE